MNLLVRMHVHCPSSYLDYLSEDGTTAAKDDKNVILVSHIPLSFIACVLNVISFLESVNDVYRMYL